MLILGLTGPSGAGKGYVCELFARYNVPSIDCDAVSKSIYLPGAPCTLELAEAFGRDILSSDGTLLRRELAQRAFSDPASTQKLNRITHPHILAALEEKIAVFASQNTQALILDAPTLIESGLHRRCDRVICVSAPQEIRLSRILQRDRLTLQQANTRIHAQPPMASYRAASDFEIVNDGTQDLEAQVLAILKACDLTS